MAAGKKPMPVMVNMTQGCFICGAPSCQLITHRIATLEVQRRSAKSRRHGNTKPIEVGPVTLQGQKEISQSAIQDMPLVSQPSNAANDWIDTFIPLPLSKVKTGTTAQFYDFFKKQSSPIQNAERGLCFDSGNHPYLFPKAIQNPALCMSSVAMAATYAGIHGRNLTAPDDEIRNTYLQSFGELRKQIEREKDVGISEATVMAAINLVMCCGVGFRDSEATLTHWRGVLALWSKPGAKYYSGPLNAFFTGLEYWLVLTMGVQPHVERWVSIISHERSPPEKYGRSFQELFTSTSLQQELLAPRIWELCLSTCRTTEILEALASDSEPSLSESYKTYYNYLRGAVAEQGMNVYSKLANADTVGECVIICLSIFYISVLRVTPWRAPLQHLCAELKRALSNCGLLQQLDMLSGKPSTKGKGRLADDYVAIMGAMRTWMLFLAACGANLCHERLDTYWAVSCLREDQEVNLNYYDVGWRANLLQDLRAFCWSETFLGNHFEAVCASVEQEK